MRYYHIIKLLNEAVAGMSLDTGNLQEVSFERNKAL